MDKLSTLKAQGQLWLIMSSKMCYSVQRQTRGKTFKPFINISAFVLHFILITLVQTHKQISAVLRVCELSWRISCHWASWKEVLYWFVWCTDCAEHGDKWSAYGVQFAVLQSTKTSGDQTCCILGIWRNIPLKHETSKHLSKHSEASIHWQKYLGRHWVKWPYCGLVIVYAICYMQI